MKKIVFFLFSFVFVAHCFAFPPGAFKPDGASGWCIQKVKALPKEPLSPKEKAWLLKMREEEKLAHDVYFTILQRWPLRAFENITNSEQKHMDMVKALLDKYGLKDPVKGLGMGYFKSKEFSELYSEMVKRGMKNFGEAIKVGAEIEELDIHDLQQALKEVDNQDVKLVFQNLMKASRNHLRIFSNWLKKIGENYQPKYISKEEYQKTISTPIERGPVDINGKPIKRIN